MSQRHMASKAGLQAWIFFMCVFAWAAQAQAIDDYGNTCAEAFPAELNSTISGFIEAGGDYDFYKIQVPSSGMLTLHTSGETDTYGYLTDSACNPITEDDNGAGDGMNFYIARKVLPGTYFVAVRHADSISAGAYELSLSFDYPVPVNILLMLDNSGSMNYPAYPDPYNPDADGIYEGTTINAQYTGGGCQVSVPVSSGIDDAEERLKDNAVFYCDFDWRNSADLDLSRDDFCSEYVHTKCSPDACANYEEQVTGIRFQNVAIPKTVNGVPVIITSARIVFTAYVTSETGNSATLYIAGEAADDAAGFTTDTGNISARPETAARVTWADVGPWTIDTTVNAASPDLKDIVQEIIDRPGWTAGNDMVFKITGKAGSARRAYSYNTSATRAPRLLITYEPCEAYKYYGYFDPDARYGYAAGRFVRDSNGDWSGNFLNWLTMRRIDVLRKALMGGRRACESCGGLATLTGEVPAQASRYWQTYYEGIGASPYPQAWYGLKDGLLYVKQTTSYTENKSPWESPDAVFTIAVAIDQAVEPELFCAAGNFAGNPCGILQKVAGQARWGNIWFEDSSYEGGEIASPVGSNMQDILNDVAMMGADTATPLAETLLTSMKYFQQSCTLPAGYPFNCSNWAPGATVDPFFDKFQFMPSARSFVLMMTDGVPSGDENIPEVFQDYDGDANEQIRSVTDYLDDVALYAHTTDLRADLEGEQTMGTYVIYAFGKDTEAQVLLKETAINGGFKDGNGNMLPDGYLNDGNFTGLPAAERIEWDANGDGIPDNFYEAQDGYALEVNLQAAIAEMAPFSEIDCADGVDNDDDGLSDCADPDCQAFDNDNDGYAVCAGDCNENNASLYPGAGCALVTTTTTTSIQPTTTTSQPLTTTTTVATPWQDFNYAESGGAIAITGYTGTGGAVVIPDAIDGKPVVGIGDHAFAYNANLTSVTIPDSVTSIGALAFWSCASLASVFVSSSVASVGDSAFSYCSRLTSITVADGNPYYSSQDGVLYNYAKTILIQYPGGKLGAFAVPDSVTTIGGHAFAYCDRLTSVAIPASVMSIGFSSIGAPPFNCCFGLTSIVVDAGNPNYSSQDGVLYNYAKTTLIQYPPGKSGAYAIPNTVTVIGSYSFNWCIGLTSVTIQDSVTAIGDWAFSSCRSLSNVILPTSLMSVGEGAFRECESLASVIIPSSVASIGDWAFGCCSSLTNITINPGKI